ncbi:uncharacterized protein M421DRAFT_409175 [Didymella exigua CBS 183.55]|uniref:Uncharacterized protein n=1 Tax=Didymella exigua CBS 183.55 TaxID=1150837 RepID=A0A6A5RYT5_9PLEO|nr:uncharacterized protein M421DRAFT_409175 [Didymella exigua CBS 183.55]KAF1931466.1 hypothetical protein M421DRAFT_409175 [Didymella exigua CBS 183.55]
MYAIGFNQTSGVAQRALQSLKYICRVSSCLLDNWFRNRLPVNVLYHRASHITELVKICQDQHNSALHSMS